MKAGIQTGECTSSAANLSTAVKGASSGTLSLHTETVSYRRAEQRDMKVHIEYTNLNDAKSVLKIESEGVHFVRQFRI